MLRLLACLTLLPQTTVLAQDVFTHQLVTMTLPAGWATKPPPSPEQGMIAMVGSQALGANGVLHAGDFGNLRKTLELGRGIVIAGLPGAIPDTAVYEFKTTAGEPVMLQGFSGTMSYAGKDVELSVLLAVTVNGRRGVMCYVFFPPGKAAQVGKEFGDLIRSIT